MDNIKIGLRMWNGFIWLRIGIGSGLCEYGNEPYMPYKGRIF
jgi:hypothetical protein